ncbi:AMP-binding enzyme [Rhizodiscina lignyota]|uniref:AMP-binding enzyme n=1 Tax=Rhizodiscina lignyota TaxID=1504668 RepID=A0A9P4IPW0_9PEZI|nr:AMP-binding enzyme [Rhizodiscina lignyota]
MSATSSASSNLSILHGPSDPPLIDLSLGALLDLQCQLYGPNECLIVPWTGARWTYNSLRLESIKLAKMLLDAGIQLGDRVAVMAGNCEQFAALLFAATRMGAILVVLNNTYTAVEAIHAMKHTGCKILFTTSSIGKLDNTPLLSILVSDLEAVPSLEEVVIVYGDSRGFRTYHEAVLLGSTLPNRALNDVQEYINCHQICMLLFTSGSTGNPKAASLTHFNVVNNARFIGDRMQLTPSDILCCPPPLFHCFGLVLGLLAVFTHGGKIVYPGEVFDPPATLRAISDEQCTALHGVPAMFDSLFSLPRIGLNITKLRTGIIAGAPVPKHLMQKMFKEFGMREFTSSYGLTEASPTCFNAFTYDTIDRKLTTVGTLLPHAHAKIVDRNGGVVPIGTPGELCIAGYQLQAGYWMNPEKTAEVMVRDNNGVLWLRTGDEAVFNSEGYCSITGRFKDMIIRGGENIYPLEIEERLMAHPAIERAIVVAVEHAKYGEVVGTFLQLRSGQVQPSDEKLREWTRETLGWHKSPAHVFWLGKDGIPGQVPLTGSGKVQKYVLKDIAGQRLLGGARL